MGRFVSADPGALHIGHTINPQKWNRYSYVINGPLVFVDMNGEEEFEFRITAAIEKDKTYFPVPAKGGMKFEQTFTIETDPSLSPSGFVSYENKVGPSEGTTLQANDVAGVTIYEVWGKGQAGSEGLSLDKQQVSRNSDGDVVIDSSATAAYPLLPGPSIDSMFKIIISREGKIKSFKAQHDRFPSHILEYRRVGESRWTELYHYPPCWWCSTINLLPGNQINEEKKLKEKVKSKIIYKFK
jgi:hypothetical protein